jgi:branched-chain amino acid aminotransferase
LLTIYSHPATSGDGFFIYIQSMNYVCVDGKLLPADQPVLLADNRGYRYGDGLFETMKMVRQSISLEVFHFQRFFAGLQVLGFEIPTLFTPRRLEQEIHQLCKKNQCDDLARIRLSAFRGNGGIYDTTTWMQYIIECWPIPESANQWPENGLDIGLFRDARKSCDLFANLKSANFLPYVMAARYARENKWNDCLVLNQHGRIADATIANLFLIKEKAILTPSLSEGCVNGVMRRYLLEKLKAENSGLTIMEQPITLDDLLNADEVFLTNSLNGIKWVKQLQDKKYTNLLSKRIYDQYIKTIWQ